MLKTFFIALLVFWFVFWHLSSILDTRTFFFCLEPFFQAHSSDILYLLFLLFLFQISKLSDNQNRTLKGHYKRFQKRYFQRNYVLNQTWGPRSWKIIKILKSQIIFHCNLHREFQKQTTSRISWSNFPLLRAQTRFFITVCFKT